MSNEFLDYVEDIIDAMEKAEIGDGSGKCEIEEIFEEEKLTKGLPMVEIVDTKQQLNQEAAQ